MLERNPLKPPRFNMQVLLGFLLGIAASLGSLFFSIFLGTAMAWRQKWAFPTLTAICLVAIGIVGLRHLRESKYAVGVEIALAVALLLDLAYGVAFLR
jgi:hypothetical protein